MVNGLQLDGMEWSKHVWSPLLSFASVVGRHGAITML